MEQTIQNSPGTDNVTVQSVDEKITSFFHFDALLSAQYFDTLRRKTLLEPEKRLMLAVLDDAVNCYRDNLFSRREKNKRLFDAAKAIEMPGAHFIARQGIRRTEGKRLSQSVRRYRARKSCASEH
jgi:hypothetical protein